MYQDFLILGGAGLVGLQVCRHIMTSMQPAKIVVASLFEHEARQACQTLEKEFGTSVVFVPEWGNLFVPSDLSGVSRRDLIQDNGKRRRLLASLYDDFEKPILRIIWPK